MAKIETILSGLLTASAVLLAGSYAYKQFKPQASASPEGDRPSYMADWRDISRIGFHSGPKNAKVEIIEFSDLECPFCRMSHETLRLLMRKYPNEVAYIFVHFPLPNHKFALPAAIAAECAGQQVDLMSAIDVLFEKQDSLGLKSWDSYARDAGVTDSANFSNCVATRPRFESIEDGLAMGKQIKIRGTPTILINGWRYPGAPAPSELQSIIEDIIIGKAPFPRR